MEEAFNKRDAGAWSAFYTEGAIDFWHAKGGTVGLPAIVKRYEAWFSSAHHAPMSFKVAQVYAIIANKICAIVNYNDHYFTRDRL
jgi:ketosteroid isomerase-like protein